MKIGTRSLLFGVHQIFWHPLTVLLAWIKLYKAFPNWKELVCIFIHDWGYWGCSDMDGSDGNNHPEYAANLAKKWFGEKYYELCLYHSRHYSREHDAIPSRLCWADKLSIQFEPYILYVPRAILSGEIYEYRKMSAKAGYISLIESHRTWFNWVKPWLIKQGNKQISAKKLC